MLSDHLWKIRRLGRAGLVLSYEIKYLKQYIAHRGRIKTLLFYPDRPLTYTTIYKLCHREGVRISTNSAKPFDFAINWQDATVRALDSTLTQLMQSTILLNEACTDISKKRVEQAHQLTFGYGLAVDASTFVGPCVRKSNANGVHDGEVVEGPLSIEATQQATSQGSIFLRLVQNNVTISHPKLNGNTDDFIQDYRIPYFSGSMPFCYIKYRPKDIRFKNENFCVAVSDMAANFSQEEIGQIRAFCREMGLDYGELDVLRDTSDGRIYIVDVNNTPTGPPNRISAKDEEMALSRLGTAFVNAFC